MDNATFINLHKLGLTPMFDLFMPKSQARNSMSSSNNPYASFMSNVGQSLSIQINKLLEPLSIKDMEEAMKKCEVFFKTIDSWKVLQQTYITKLREIQTTFKEKSFINDSSKDKANQQKKSQSYKPTSSQIIDNELVNLFETLITRHKAMFDKITYDISYVNMETFQSLSKQIKQILSEQKSYLKQLNSVKDQLEKVLSKKMKLKKQKDEELMLKIFMEDGSQQFMMDQKLKKHNKYNQIRKQLEEYELKVSQSVDQYQRSSQNLKKNHLEYYEKIDRLTECKYQTVIKMQLHLLTYYRNLVEGINSISKEIQVFMDEGTDAMEISPTKQKNNIIFDEIQRKNKLNKIRIQQNRRNQFQILQKLQEKSVGYVQYSLKIIDQKQFDQLLIYSRDKDVKGKIKRMIETNDVNPEDTDETCRQIQLIKKFIRSDGQESQLLQIFGNMIAKNSKLRMNFIFLLQFFRINGKFQLTIEQFKPIYRLINIFMETCHQNRDCFVLKQLMILLTTYFVTLEEEPLGIEKKQSDSELETDNSPCFEDKSLSPETPIQLGELQKKKKKTSSSSSSISTKQKIYILQFFKDHELWHDLQFWESLLIECIYAEKRNTIKNLVRGTQTTQKNEMLQAQKTAILNQILYVVRNMIIFDFTEKDVKNFGLRFCKLLKLDDRGLKDIYKTVEEAAKEEIQTKQCESIEKYLEKLRN